MKVRFGKNRNFFRVISLSANLVADRVNDLAKDKHCHRKEKCGYMVTKTANAHTSKCRKMSYKLVISRYILPV
jgi:hypothetical protein